MEEPHIRIIPNIGRNADTKRRNIFEETSSENVRHDEIPPLQRKKIDILNIETQKTNEEFAEKKEVSVFTWLVIALVVVVVILLIFVIYYTLTKNSNDANLAALHKIVEPTINPIHRAVYSSGAVSQEQPSQQQYHQKQSSEERHQLYVDPTEEELDRALQRANNIKNDNLEKVDKVDKKDEKDEKYIQMSEHIERLIIDEEIDDNDDFDVNRVEQSEIEQFHTSVIEEA